MRIDLNKPMTVGNFILFKGERNTGKSRLAMDTVKQYLEQDTKNNKAVFMSLNKKTGDEFISVLGEHAKNAVSISCDTKESISDAEYLLSPLVGLHATIQEYKHNNKNVILVFDDVLLHSIKEKQVYDLAEQPASPISLINEIMEHTGVFPSTGTSVTSILVADTSSSTEQWQKDQDNVLNHIESISDQVITFEVDIKKRAITVPVLDIKPG